MDAKKLDELVDNIDHLLSEFIEKRDASRANRGPVIGDVDIESVLERGAFPRDDPTTPSYLALYSIGETLGLVGGEKLMHTVYDAYEAKFGPVKANSLSGRWDSAAGLWYY